MTASPYPACPSPFNLAAHVLGQADVVPDKIALAILKPTGAERWSYARLKQAVLGCATGLMNAGLIPGDRLLMRVGNTVDFPIAYLGAIAVGVIPIPTSSQLTAPELRVMTDMVKPAAVLHDGITTCPDDLRILPTSDLQAWADLPPASFDFGDPNRLAYIIFTSGTSGKPRAVCHAHRAIWARGMMMDGWYGLTETDRLMHAGAFNWTYTLGTGLLDPWTKGATALIAAPGVDHSQLPLLMKRNEVSIFAAAPGVYRNLLRSPNLSFPKLRHALSAGEKLPSRINTAWHDATGTRIYEAFGMSECSTFISTAPDMADVSADSLGWPQPGRCVSLRDDNGEVARGETGIIAIHKDDPGLMLGYLDDAHATQSRYRSDWFLTGDTGHMTDAGDIHYHGRADDMMNAGGFRVSPLEVENALLSFPGLQDVGVTEVEVKADTKVIGAFYLASDTVDEDALAAHAAERLARYKQPRLYRRVSELSRNANGKLVRRALPDVPAL